MENINWLHTESYGFVLEYCLLYHTRLSHNTAVKYYHSLSVSVGVCQCVNGVPMWKILHTDYHIVLVSY